MHQMHMHKAVTRRVKAKSYSLIEGSRTSPNTVTTEQWLDYMGAHIIMYPLLWA